jgi:hypothetical protein
LRWYNPYSSQAEHEVPKKLSRSACVFRENSLHTPEIIPFEMSRLRPSGLTDGADLIDKTQQWLPILQKRECLTLPP